MRSLVRAVAGALLAGWLSAAAAAQETAAPTPAAAGFKIRISGENVNIRARADTNSLVVGQCQSGDVLEATGIEFGFYRIVPPADTFCHVGAVFVDIGENNVGRVSTQSGNLRLRAASAVVPVDPLKSEVLTLLPPGTELQVVGRDGDWLRVRPPAGVYFYLSEEFAARVADSGEPRGEAPSTAPVVTAPPAATSRPTVARPAPPRVATSRPVTPAVARGEWSEALVAIESRIEAERRKPEAEQNWVEILHALYPLSEQKDEPLVARLATAWTSRIQEQLAAREPRREPPHTPTTAQRAPAERAPTAVVREPAPRRTRPPMMADLRGELQTSYVFSKAEHPRRYCLSDPISRVVLAYVDFPVDFPEPPEAYLGRFVALRGVRRDEPSVTVGIVELTEIMIILPDMSTSRPARRAP
ncbi:MAG: hypothetical protein CHACPFDD_02168 [Phycisphaerae bacterium]|nr:hypothetical protein [Phycisphaerae bacterium]